MSRSSGSPSARSTPSRSTHSSPDPSRTAAAISSVEMSSFNPSFAGRRQDVIITATFSPYARSEKCSCYHAASIVTVQRRALKRVSPPDHKRCAVPSEASLYQDLRIFTGNAHPQLATAICQSLEMPLGECEVFEFSNENIFVRILENVRSRDVFLVQPISSPVNRSVMELLIMIDAFKRASAGRITAVMPYYGYGRSDKKDQPRVPITARLLANLIETAGADRVLTVDLHAGQIQGFFNIPVDELTAVYTLVRHLKADDLSNTTILATDVGGEKRARNVSRLLEVPLAIALKERVGNEERVVAKVLIGDRRDREVLIVDVE